MKFELKDYQEGAVRQLLDHVRGARQGAGVASKHAFVLSAPTGSGKTAIITAVMERLLAGDDVHEADTDATFLWVTDAPELNEQSKKKIMASSEIFTPNRVETVDAAFDQPVFDSGKIYFLNTQKLGQATTFTKTADARNHSLWETLSRTATNRPKSFYLILDEAHKGLGRRLASEVREVATIVSRLIVGNGGAVSPFLLIGISATPKRFNDLLERAADRVRWPTHISPEDVRESGLIKDEIILWHTKKNGKTDWALLNQALLKLQEYDKGWQSFCKREDRDVVRPILLIQVTDGTGKKPSNTNLVQVLAHIERVLGPLPSVAVAHCFQNIGALDLRGGKRIRKIQPSEIQDDEDVRIVLFKMALNTGWDCPRAETMMSFRRAVDHTLIAQLVGRMVRTPLAERVLSDPFLNSVALYLPNWDDKALTQVIDHLTRSEDSVPATIERAENLAICSRAPRSKALFQAAALLPTYPSKRANKASNVKRLMQLARYLANDNIDPTALHAASGLVLKTLEASRTRLKGRMRKLVEAIQEADLEETRIAIGIAPGERRTGNEGAGPAATALHRIRLVEENIRDLFAEAGRRLGAGLHVAYVDRRTSSKQRPPTPTIARAELCVLVSDKATLDALELLAGKTVRKWWSKHHGARLSLSAERQAEYGRVNRMAPTPEPEDLILPPYLQLKRGPKPFKKHIYAEEDNTFKPSPPLNHWEEMTLQDEMIRKGFRGWYRNPVRKEWSLGIPYEATGVPSVQYPDFLVFRSGGKSSVVVDLLEPHAPHQEDLTPKLLGLCKFADQHGDRFGRIELILVEGAKDKERLLRIDVNDPDVRDQAKILTENRQVIALARALNK